MDIQLKSKLGIVKELEVDVKPMTNEYKFNVVPSKINEHLCATKATPNNFNLIGEMRASMSYTPNTKLFETLVQSNNNELNEFNIKDGRNGNTIKTFRNSFTITINALSSLITKVTNNSNLPISANRIIFYNLEIIKDNKIIYNNNSDINVSDFNDENEIVKLSKLYIDSGEIYFEIANGLSEDSIFEVNIDLIYS